MPAQTLLIANPPHHTVDARRAAPVLELIAVEVMLKANYPVPEIWLADPDAGRVRAAAAELAAAGVNAVIASGDQLAAVPAQLLVQSFEFTEHGLVAVTRTARREIGTRDPVLIVISTPRPPQEGAGAVGTMTIEGTQLSELSPFVDFYVPMPYGVERLAVFAEIADFAALGHEAGPSSMHNLAHFARLLEERLPGASFDRRLVNMQLRRKLRIGAPAHRDARRGYSFASPGLGELLADIAPTWTDISQADFSSRLVCLIHELTSASGGRERVELDPQRSSCSGDVATPMAPPTATDPAPGSLPACAASSQRME